MPYIHEDGVPQTTTEKKSLGDRIPTLRQVGGGVLVLVGFVIGTAYATGRKAADFVNDVGDAYYEHEYGDNKDKNI